MAEQREHYPPLPTKPPNKAQHEKACQRLQNLITEREEERRRLSAEVIPLISLDWMVYKFLDHLVQRNKGDHLCTEPSSFLFSFSDKVL